MTLSDELINLVRKEELFRCAGIACDLEISHLKNLIDEMEEFWNKFLEKSKEKSK